MNSLYIKNYRNLKELKINSLGKVNLITGKNNTGKSAILEAIAIYATKGDLSLIYELLKERGETNDEWRKEENKDATESNARELSSLFTDRNIDFEKDGAIFIGELASLAKEKSSEESVSLRFVKYVEETQKDNQGNISQIRKIGLTKELDQQLANYTVGMEIRVGSHSFILPLDSNRPYRWFGRELGTKTNFQFIRTRNINREINGKLFDKIILTDKEKYVIDALKIIEPSTERIAFVEEDPRERSAVIKLSNNQEVLPLQSMGDGINRILTIILALVNSDKGFLLIDEFENGLHYTVQEQLWSILFNLAQTLDIQVFVTTHSEDCISGFEKVLNNSSIHSLDGKLIRLDNENGTIKQVEFNATELKIAHDQNIEIR